MADMKEIDLHMHSSYSDDGEFTPKELLNFGRRQGFSACPSPTTTV